ncbi:hypothetical protein ACIBKZ_08025 [Streptomyces sp. NPDC050421]|uniref:hypothetical protein n=1 Tax=Streptomyces sp. NPDC050421 TaxID=3365613 RepID=UPI00378F868A
MNGASGTLAVLYLRSRAVPRTAALTRIVLVAAWAAAQLESHVGHSARVPVLVLAPLLVPRRERG